MANSFLELKKNRKSSLGELKAAAEKLNDKGNNNKDERYWAPTVDKEGNGSAIIRFLPVPNGEEYPYVRLWDHGFQGPTGLWYIENSRTTLGQGAEDPVGKMNSRLWKSGIESDKEIARKQKRRLHFISNILVIRDPANPENDGKQFLFKYGKKIFDKVNDAMNPSFEDEEAINPFDPWDGANFRLRIRKVDGYRNYDKSEFDSPSAIGDDEFIERIWKKEYSLMELVSADKFKPYEELESQLNRVLGLSGSSPAANRSSEPREDAPKQKETPEPRQAASSTVDDDDDLEAFRRALEDDNE